MKKLIIAILFLAVTCIVRASQEGILAFSSFRLESDGIGSSGKVVVEGKQNEKRQIVTMRISAFGKEYVVPKEKLAQLVELPANGIRISYEAGYKELGGRMIYIQLQMGFTSSTKKQALITLTENGKIEVSEIQTRDT